MALLEAVKIQTPQTFFIWKQQENSPRKRWDSSHLTANIYSVTGSSLAGPLSFLYSKLNELSLLRLSSLDLC